MKKVTKLKICNWSLLALTIAILISGIQLEVTNSFGIISIWIHIFIGLLFMSLAACHVYLHFGKSNWLFKFSKQKSQVTRILWWVSLAVLISGIAAFTHWIGLHVHSSIGGVHGKIGFLMILLSIGHISKRFKFFKIRWRN